MAKLVRVKTGPHPWVTEVETGGGGGGGDLESTLAAGNDAGDQQIKGLQDGNDDQDAVTVAQLFAAANLAAVLSEGSDADGFQITNLADGTNPTDAVTLQQLEAGAPTLDAVLTNGDDAGEQDITNVGTLNAHIANLDGGDGSNIALHATGPSGGAAIAFIGDEGDSFGITVNVGSVSLNADANNDGIVSMSVGPGTMGVDGDGLHLGDASGGALVGMFGQTPIAQGTAIEDATTPGEAVTQLNLLLAFLRERGDIALS